jgi:hypothetical protein
VQAGANGKCSIDKTLEIWEQGENNISLLEIYYCVVIYTPISLAIRLSLL